MFLSAFFIISSQIQTGNASFGANAVDPQVKMMQVNHPTGSYLSGNLIYTELSLFNPSKTTKTVTLNWYLSNSHGKEVTQQTIKVTCQPMQTTPISLPWLLSDELLPGHYFTTVALYAQDNRLGFHGASDGFWLFKTQTTLENLVADGWQISDKQLGKSRLKPDNVGTFEGRLALRLPAGTTEGAEIWHQPLLSYGTYAIRMKLPNAPGSITGFFLYATPDYYNEIDIELYNQTESKVMLTTYADGDRQNSFEQSLSFDPTKAYHEYLIDYRETGLSFYVDGKWLKTWNSGYSHNPMYLMVNTWYPKWLEAENTQKAENLLIEWIRRY